MPRIAMPTRNSYQRVTAGGVIGLATLSLPLMLLCPAPLSARQTGKTPPDPAASEFFEKRVRPLLLERCSSCHGGQTPAGGLGLTAGADLVRGGKSGPVVVAGDPDHSRLIAAIHYDGALKMPPAGRLSAAEVETLTAWVKAGAVWPAASLPHVATPAKSSPYGIHPERRNFWAFLPVRRPAIPTVKQRSWVKTQLDAFVLAKLEAKGLQPAAQADRRTLIRRATFDLTGLPPTPEEVTAFLNDKSPNAWAKVVDRLLASPRYGERWGRHWLDVVRYCDSLDARGLGGEGDISEAWRYRDWVVNAFNRDMPYSDFMMNQVAGDLLPAANSPGDLNLEGTIATGMLAIGNWGNGDADKEKILTDIADDQVDVVSRGFMGLTVGCARCHDHKFDPISTRDYYGLAGIFFSTHILPKLTPKGAGETPLRIPLLTKAETARRDAYAAQVRDLEARRKGMAEAAYREQVHTLTPQTSRYVLAAWDYANRPDDLITVSLADYARKQGLEPYALRQWYDALGWADAALMTTSTPNVAGNVGVFGWRGAADAPSLTINANAAPRPILTFTLPPHSVCVHPGPNSGVAIAWKSQVTGLVDVSGGVADADPGGGDGIAWVLERQGRSGRVALATGDFPNGGKQDFAQGQGAERLRGVTVRAGETLRLIVLPKANYYFDTTAVSWRIMERASGKVWDVERDLVAEPLQGNPHKDSYGNAAVWSFCDMGDAGSGGTTGAESAINAWRSAVANLNLSPQNRALVEQAAAALAKSFTKEDAHSPFWIGRREDETALPANRRQELAALDSALTTLQKNPPAPILYANGAQDGGVPESSQAGFHDVRVHIRGSYLRLGDVAPRRFPVVLAGETQTPITQGSGRLDLARWLASPKHPLTARVMVNRIWQHHFGEGIVRTPSNFGFLGERPTHPELLDWLADRFVQSGWSIKQMHRLIMLSSTYQQSAQAQPQTLKLDPANRLWGHMNRQRLEAEALRDSLLTVAGKLDTAMGGQAIRDFNSPRRTLYIMTIRSDRTGYGSLFDAADPTSSMDRRTSSTVAPQALFLLNDAFVLTQARALAERLLHDAPQSNEARIQRAYMLLYGRPPSVAEIKIGRQLLTSPAMHPAPANAGAGTVQTAVDANVGKPAMKLAARSENVGSNAELAAWTAYCQVLLCTNEFMYVD
jgi:mono/diheme cytochrome c family protein